MRNRIAFCGVDCSKCSDFMNQKCPSCKLTKWKDNDACMPVKCCQEKGIDFCAFCSVFPCEEMAGFYKESDSHREARIRMESMRRKE